MSDIEKSFETANVKVEEQAPQSNSKAYNKVSPSTVLKDEGGTQLKVYIYPSAADSKKGQDEFNREIAKDLTYGMKEISIQAKNVLFISFGFTDTEVRAIEKLK